MLNGNGSTGFERKGFQEHPQQREERAGGFRYAHILTPTSLALTDRPALTLGMQMAAMHRSTLTALHVVPSNGHEHSMHWLDAIGELHRAVDRIDGFAPPRGVLDSTETTRARVQRFLASVVPESLLDQVDVRAECRTGEVADEIARFADAAAVDLVIMASRLSRWWLPSLAPRVRRVLQLTRRQVILVGPDAVAHPGVAADAVQYGPVT